MPRRKRARISPARTHAVEPFESAEEAWLWYAQAQLLRNAGGVANRRIGESARPCDPDDIYRWVMALRRRGTLAPAHLRVLARYGAKLAPPDPRTPEEAADAHRWHEALDRLHHILVAKGIVHAAVSDDSSIGYGGAG